MKIIVGFKCVKGLQFLFAGSLMFTISCDKRDQVQHTPRQEAPASRPQAKPKPAKAPYAPDGVQPEKPVKYVTYGSEQIPEEWFKNCSSVVQQKIRDEKFDYRDIGLVSPDAAPEFPWNWTCEIGVYDENEKFTSWPGARKMLRSEVPEEYMFRGVTTDVSF